MISGQLKLGAEEGRLISVPASQIEKTDNRWRVK
jgi:hypothetical protein